MFVPFRHQDTNEFFHFRQHLDTAIPMLDEIVQSQALWLTVALSWKMYYGGSTFLGATLPLLGCLEAWLYQAQSPSKHF